MLSAFNELTVCVTNLSMASLENAALVSSSFVTSEGGKRNQQYKGYCIQTAKSNHCVQLNLQDIVLFFVRIEVFVPGLVFGFSEFEKNCTFII